MKLPSPSLLASASALLSASLVCVSASPLTLALAPTTRTTSTPLCAPEHSGIISPAANATITQVSSSYASTTFEIIYCSGQYDKTSSTDASIWLTSPSSPYDGNLLAKNVVPDNADATPGFYSYRLNVTLSPEDGDYFQGVYVLSVYETTTGYYNPMNFDITSINVTLAVTSS